MLPNLSQRLKDAAKEIGFDLVGIAPAVTPPGHSSFLEWLDRGYAGTMGYLESRREAYAHPSGVMPAVKSVVMLGLVYDTEAARKRRRDPDSPHQSDSGLHAARVSSYAWGSADYHDLIRKRLKKLGRFLREQDPNAATRGVVDTAPLLERDFARLAGLGWFGKNAMLINKHAGSYFFLAGLLTDLVLDYDDPHHAQHCGTCTRCLEACPTDAFAAPGVLDATRCLSYLTIELQGDIPDDLRPGLGDWLFGCDICQDVCPWNRKSPTTSEPVFQPDADLHPADAVELLALDEDAFKERFRKSPLARPRRSGLLRNAAIVLGNRADRSALSALANAARDDDPTIREAAKWAIERIEARTGDGVAARFSRVQGNGEEGRSELGGF